jgi:hypothetical protein
MPIEENGPIVTGTIRNLVDGLRSHPMTPEAVDAVKQQVSIFAERLVSAYCAEISPGEVGIGGTSRASEAPIIGVAPRVLLYGRIQSGKTVAMILTAAMALDNGFRVVVVLTTDNVALVRQTASRFKNLDGPRVFSGVKDGNSYEWEGQEEQLRAAVPTDGIVFVCSKNFVNLPRVIRFLQQLEASSYPVLLMDDEADAATPDTTAAARSAAKPNAPAYASTINRLIIENDNPTEVGFSLGEALPHSLYIQVTATPYVLVLQRRNAKIRPTVQILLEPGRGYCGGEVFFGQYDPDSEDNPYPGKVVVVGPNEAALMTRRVPTGLAKSIDFFILSACAKAWVDGWPPLGEGFKHLSHTSPNTDDHEVVANHISTHLNELRNTALRDPDGFNEYFAEAYTELQRSLQQCPRLDDLYNLALGALRQTEIIRVNSKGDITPYGPRLNFMVGGNILGRGLTIDDLLVTYYIREAKAPQMDTVWQHARMFGYRQRYLEYMRIYLPHRLGVRFKKIHEAEEALRNALIGNDDDKAILIALPAAARPTRPNALEVDVVRTIPAGRAQINPHSSKLDTDAAAIVLGLLIQNNVPIVNNERLERAIRVPYEALRELVRAVRTADDDPGYWQEDVALALLSAYEEVTQNGSIVYVRQLQADAQQYRSRGRLSGPEVELIRAAAGAVPALVLLYQGDPDAPEAWYPTLVMPAGAPAMVFSAL